MSIGSREQVRPTGQDPGHCAVQPSLCPQVAPAGQLGTHTQRPIVVLQTLPAGQRVPVPHEGAPEQTLLMD